MEDVSCNICLNNFDDKIFIPKIIECGHTTCSNCLAFIIRSSKLCPVCRQVITIDEVSKCPTVYALLGLGSDKEFHLKKSVKSLASKYNEAIESLEEEIQEKKTQLDNVRNGLNRLQVIDSTCSSNRSEYSEKNSDKLDINAVKLNVDDCLDIVRDLQCKLFEIGKFEIGTENKLKLSEVKNKEEFIKEIHKRVEKGEKIYATHKVNFVSRYGKISILNSRILVSSLTERIEEIYGIFTTVEFVDLKQCIPAKQSEAFLDVNCNRSEETRKVFISLENSDCASTFLKICTGELGHTYKDIGYFKGKDTVVSFQRYPVKSYPNPQYRSRCTEKSVLEVNGSANWPRFTHKASSDSVDLIRGDIIVRWQNGGSFQIYEHRLPKTTSINQTIIGKVLPSSAVSFKDTLIEFVYGSLLNAVSHEVGSHKRIVDCGLVLYMKLKAADCVIPFGCF